MKLKSCALVLLLPALLAAACTSPGTTGGTTSAESARRTNEETPEEKLSRLRSDLDRNLVAGPTVSDEIGYRTVWQARLEGDASATLIGVHHTSDTLLVWDSIGVVTRLRPSDGTILWRAATASALDRVLGAMIVPVGSVEQAAIVTDTQAFMLDAGNGLFVSRQPFRRLANTGAVLQPPFLVYGTRAGQVVWHDYVVGSDARAGQLDGQVITTPRLVAGRIIAASTGGSVSAFGASDGRLVWERRLNGGIVARPAADDRAVWVPCEDQYLWCLSLRDGRALWRYFTQASLRASPMLLEDGLYLQLPGEGLACFEPIPQDKLDGVVRWRCSEATGDVIGVCRAGLLAWDSQTRTLFVIEEGSGSLVRSLRMPGAFDVRMIDPIDGDLLVTGEDGRVQRLTPIVRRARISRS